MSELCRVWVNLGVSHGWQRLTKPFPRDLADLVRAAIDLETVVLDESATAADLAAFLTNVRTSLMALDAGPEEPGDPDPPWPLWVLSCLWCVLWVTFLVVLWLR